MDELFPIPLSEQINAVEREIALRERVYSRRVAEKKMTRFMADKEITRMRAVRETLLMVQRGGP